MEQFEGRKLSQKLVDSLMSLTQGAAVFATAREDGPDGPVMQHILTKVGFTPAGKSFLNEDHSYNLLLYVRPAL